MASAADMGLEAEFIPAYCRPAPAAQFCIAAIEYGPPVAQRIQGARQTRLLAYLAEPPERHLSLQAKALLLAAEEAQTGSARPVSRCSGGGALTASAGGSVIGLTGGALPASGRCTIVVNVAGTILGQKQNITGVIVLQNAGGTTNLGSAALVAGAGGLTGTMIVGAPVAAGS
jgi:hypothetical protein